jgi:hypothetical protein
MSLPVPCILSIVLTILIQGHQRHSSKHQQKYFYVLLMISLHIILFYASLISLTKFSYQVVTFFVKSLKEIRWELLQCGFLLLAVWMAD